VFENARTELRDGPTAARHVDRLAALDLFQNLFEIPLEFANRNRRSTQV
jgi:hypothetical protein